MVYEGKFKLFDPSAARVKKFKFARINHKFDQNGQKFNFKLFSDRKFAQCSFMYHIVIKITRTKFRDKIWGQDLGNFFFFLMGDKILFEGQHF